MSLKHGDVSLKKVTCHSRVGDVSLKSGDVSLKSGDLTNLERDERAETSRCAGLVPSCADPESR